MKVLTGEIALAQSFSAVAENMLFDSIKAKVRHQLDFLVDEPDFIEMYEYIAQLGGTKQTYIPKLLRYLEVYLEESERRLRPQAFAVPNKLGGRNGPGIPKDTDQPGQESLQTEAVGRLLPLSRIQVA